MLNTLDQKLKSPWTVIGFIVPFVALIAGVAVGLPDSEDLVAQERAGGNSHMAVALEKSSVPPPRPADVVELDDMIEIPVTVTREVTGGYSPDDMTDAYLEYQAADPGRALYFRQTDHVVHLPDDVQAKEWIMNISCIPDSFCPQTPITVYERGDAEINIDGNGNILWDLATPEEKQIFDFLTKVGK